MPKIIFACRVNMSSKSKKKLACHKFDTQRDNQIMEKQYLRQEHNAITLGRQTGMLMVNAKLILGFVLFYTIFSAKFFRDIYKLFVCMSRAL